MGDSNSNEPQSLKFLGCVAREARRNQYDFGQTWVRFFALKAFCIFYIFDNFRLKGKLTGAGGGGYAISLIPPSYDPEEVIRILQEHGFSVVATELGGPGVQID